MDIVHETEKYDKEVTEYLGRALPEKIFNAHFHITSYTRQDDPVGLPEDLEALNRFASTPEAQWKDYTDFTAAAIGPARFKGGLILPLPTNITSAEFRRQENLFVFDLASRVDCPCGYLVAPEDGREHAEEVLDTYPQITALKPYLLYSVKKDKFESDVFDFAPEWLWQIAHEREMPVVLHISHSLDMLSDPGNYEQLRIIAKRYPKAKVVLAHSAQGHCTQKLKMGLEQIIGLENIYFDCSGGPEPMSTALCVKYFGPDHMMWGDDFDYSTCLGRMVGIGGNSIGITVGEFDDSTLDPNYYKWMPISNLKEGLLFLLNVCDVMGLSESERNAVFYDNAVKMYRR